MSKWVKCTAGANNNGGYINIDNLFSLAVLPLIVDPSKYAVVAYQNDTSTCETVVTDPQTFDTVDEAMAAIEQLLDGFSVHN